jgi:hypothetical protein
MGDGPPPTSPYWDEETKIHAPNKSVGSVGNPPDHYKSSNGLQPFDVVDAFDLDFYEGNAVKYILRWKRKGGVEDLLKAKHYLNEVIERAPK